MAPLRYAFSSRRDQLSVWSMRQRQPRRCSARADPPGNPLKVLVVGGTGRVGSAVAIHLLSRHGPPDSAAQKVHVTISGRKPANPSTVQEILMGAGGVSDMRRRGRALHTLQLDYNNRPQLAAALQGVHAVVHTAGPYAGIAPVVLQAAIDAKVPVYADLADPLDYLETAKEMTAAAKDAGTVAVLAAGAFPGLSNILAVHCAKRLAAPVQDLRFSYFTAGLGGSGPVNLLITNLGFGDPVWTLRRGQRAPQLIAGEDDRTVDFFLDPSDASFARIGSRTVWAWPFPEVCTVGEHLSITGRSDVRMGTAPHAWNIVMGAMVRSVPREWWRQQAFSSALARFSEPLVALTDRFTGETHGMRVDVTAADGQNVTAVQAHDSFRVCVGQCCAEFVIHMVTHKIAGGVYLPEELTEASNGLDAALDRMSSLPGTFTYRVHTGKVAASTN